MNLAFMYQSVDDLPTALAFYRDTLGLTEAWREGETTVAFELPGSTVQLMVDLQPDDHPKWRSGLFFQVPNVVEFVKQYAELNWLDEPMEVPDGMAATFTDPAGNAIHIFDESTAGTG